jgi:molybdenum cofactor guanylyltransferase
VQATLLVLAGGESRRMGRPKALLPVAGRTLAEFVAERLTAGFDELLIAGRGPLPAALERFRVDDRFPGAGPLAGIEAGLRRARHEVVFAVACDMPRVTLDLAGRAVAACAGFDAAVPRLGGRPEPACAAYAKSAAAPIGAFLESGGRRAAEALARLRVSWLDDVDPLALSNLNTPADYEAWLAEPPPTEKHV